jgi:hypothetical protein
MTSLENDRWGLFGYIVRGRRLMVALFLILLIKFIYLQYNFKASVGKERIDTLHFSFPFQPKLIRQIYIKPYFWIIAL